MIVGGFVAPIIFLRIGLPSMSFALSSTTSISEAMPLTSWNEAIVDAVDLDLEALRDERVLRQRGNSSWHVCGPPVGRQAGSVAHVTR